MPRATASIRQPHQPGYQNNAAVVGGGTLVYGGQAWRFLPEDFRMASTYGVPAGSSLTDWPISYDDLGALVRARGVGDRRLGRQRQRRPALAPRARLSDAAGAAAVPSGRVLARGAEALGIATLTPPLLINTEPRAGRGACIQCGSCVGFPCPSDGKNGTQNTMLPRALATGACDLVTRAMVERITTDGNGRVTGVSVLVEDAGGGLTRHSAARAGGDPLPPAPSRPRGFCSRRAPPPNPTASATGTTRSDATCRGTSSSRLFGLFEDEVANDLGPGVTIATTAWNHDNPGVIGGGMVAERLHPAAGHLLEAGAAAGHAPLGRRGEGLHAPELSAADPALVPDARDSRARTAASPSIRTLRDRFGLPVARLSGTQHPETLRTGRFLCEKAAAWLTASGAARVWGTRSRRPRCRPVSTRPARRGWEPIRRGR